ncbi:hypothetical protein ABVK25_010314 [Lepraria finkii]|uniref:peptidylprolyl isomerase n=1 Tax=Lepraria finkii TaxID=1340010 RepID=A0ABR4AVT0_9LECA
MGKGTDKLYITHSEWASEDAYSASAGSGIAKSKAPDSTFKRLPFNFCAVSLQPFKTPVCTPDGHTFDIDNILPWLLKHGTNPITGKPLGSEELIKLDFHKNDEGEMVDPVTFKVFTDNTHLVALKNTGNVFAYDTVERLNIKAKMWRDLVSDEEFGRKDIITLQDPQNVQSRNLSSFKYLQDGVSTLTEAQKRERNSGVNASALGNAASMIKSAATSTSTAPSNSQVGKYLHPNPPTPSTSTNTILTKPSLLLHQRPRQNQTLAHLKIHPLQRLNPHNRPRSRLTHLNRPNPTHLRRPRPPLRRRISPKTAAGKIPRLRTHHHHSRRNKYRTPSRIRSQSRLEFHTIS